MTVYSGLTLSELIFIVVKKYFSQSSAVAHLCVFNCFRVTVKVCSEFYRALDTQTISLREIAGFGLFNGIC